MADDPAYLRNLKALTRAEPQFSHLEELEKELYVSGSDRATAVMFGSFVETHLERLLASVMRPDLNSKDRARLFEFEGALGSFSSRIVVAYAMKLIGPITRSDLDLIRLLRNEFAHSRMPFDFKTPEVRAVCDQLKIVDQPGSNIPHGYLNRVRHEDLKAAVDIKDPKTRFVAACHTISYRMLVKKDGPKPGDWAFPNDEPVP
jgi:hypothetical protein